MIRFCYKVQPVSVSWIFNQFAYEAEAIVVLSENAWNPFCCTVNIIRTNPFFMKLMTDIQLFKGRSLIIATKHRKEEVIAPLIEKALDVQCFVSASLDTDRLGTFTVEVERKEDALTTAREKCLMAMDLYQCDLAIASEGSFGPHPSLFFVPADHELVLFLDSKNGIEIVAHELSVDTNYSGEEIVSEGQLVDFAKRVYFPDHGLIMRKSKNDLYDIKKGITDWHYLTSSFHYFLERYGQVYVETDMRAMFNPTRMKVIAQATQNLIAKITTCCPKCNFPGFGITDVTNGLLCSACNLPTRSILSYRYICQHCFFIKEMKYPTGRITEDPTYCDRCNP